MVKTNRSVLAAVAFLSVFATVSLVVSLLTDQWVTAQGKFTDGKVNINNDEPLSTIKYGLFSGTILQEATYFEIKMTCLITGSNNACAYLCEWNSELRKNQLKSLVKGEYVDFNKNCPHVSKSSSKSLAVNDNVTYVRKTGEKREFLNAGLYIATTFFLCVSILFGLLSTIFSIWIAATHPTEISLSIYAVYTYNIVASIGCLVTLILWGIFFRITVINNVGILYTIQGEMDTSGMASLGFSYWLILPSCLMYLKNIVLVHVRQYPFSQEPDSKILIGGENQFEE